MINFWYVVMMSETKKDWSWLSVELYTMQFVSPVSCKNKLLILSKHHSLVAVQYTILQQWALGNNWLVLVSAMTFNCPYLNINNVPVKVNHLHVGNGTCSTAIKKVFSVLFPLFSEMTIMRPIWSHYGLENTTEGREGDTNNTSDSNKNLMKLKSVTSYKKRVYYIHVFLHPLYCLCIGAFGLELLQKQRSLLVSGWSSCWGNVAWLDVSSDEPASGFCPVSTLFFALADLLCQCVLGNKHPFVKLQFGCLVSLLSSVLVQGEICKAYVIRS